MEPSSADRGFFQEVPFLTNQFHEDAVVQRVLKLFVPAGIANRVAPELVALASEVLSPEIFAHVSDAERNLPYLCGSGRDVFGRPTSELVTAEGWRALQDFGIRKGMVAFNYDTDLGPYTRVVQMLRIHLWEGSAANTPCPSAMQDGAARLLQLQLSPRSHKGQDEKWDEGDDPGRRRAFRDAFARLTSRDPAFAWTSGQWMTERPGGSDVSRSETVATYVPGRSSPRDGEGNGGGGGGAETSRVVHHHHPLPLTGPADDGAVPLGPWSISGAKFFSSATDAGVTVLLARTTPDKRLSAFLAPTRRRRRLASPPPPGPTSTGRTGGDETEPNGVRITRLKDKLGTRPLPTAELELDGMRGWLLGREGAGVREVATVLAVTRLHSAVAAVGYLGRGLAVGRAYARVRSVATSSSSPPRLLCENPLHVRTLAGAAGSYRGLMLLSFFTAYVMGLEERGPPPSAAPAPAPAAAAAATTSSSSPASSSGSTGSAARLTPPPRLVSPLLRVLTSICKAYVCRAAVPLTHGCMEVLGGVGYLLNAEAEHLNVARLFRDACVLPIWEGTTDVLASDLVRALKGSGGKRRIEALGWLVEAIYGPPGGGGSSPHAAGRGGGAAVVVADNGGEAVLRAWTALKAEVRDRTLEGLLLSAREVLFRAAEVLIAALLRVDAESDGDLAARVVYLRFLRDKGFLAGSDGVVEAEAEEGGRDSLGTDLLIVYGPHEHGGGSGSARGSARL